MTLLFLSTIGFLFDVNLVGRLTGTEILFLLALPFVFGKARFHSKDERHFYLYAFLWLLGALITDVIRQTSFDDLARGWSKIIMLVVNFTVFRALLDGDRKKTIRYVFLLLLAQAVRLAIGGDVDTMALGSSDFTPDSWKFGYGQLVTACVLLLSSSMSQRKMMRMPSKLLPYGMALFNLALNARNLTGITMLAALAGTLTGNRKKQISRASLVVFACFFLVAGVGTVKLYEFAAENGYLSDAAREKYEHQKEGDLGILIGGRTEILASSQAVIDSPLIGHGSWARDPKYVNIMIEALLKSGKELQGNGPEDDLIPTHSHLMGAWVEQGLLGALFWFWAIWVTLKALYATLRTPDRYTAFYAFVAISLLWDIAFSPLGLTRRLVTPAWLYMMMLVANPDTQKDESEKKECKK